MRRFRTKEIKESVHYDLREVGIRVPENKPQNRADVLLDFDNLAIVQRGGESTIDSVLTRNIQIGREIIRLGFVAITKYEILCCGLPDNKNATLLLLAIAIDDTTIVPTPSTIRPTKMCCLLLPS